MKQEITNIFRYIGETDKNFINSNYYVGIAVNDEINRDFAIQAEDGGSNVFLGKDVKKLFRSLSVDEIVDEILGYFVETVTSHSWNTTSQKGTISKVLVALTNNNLWDKISKDWEVENRQRYMRDFYNNMKVLNCYFEFDSEKNFNEILIRNLLNSFMVDKLFENNYRFLAENNIVDCLGDFNTSFRGKILEIKDANVEGFKLIKTSGSIYLYYISDRFVKTQSFETYEQALLYALFGDGHFFTILKFHEAIKKDEE